MTNYSLKPTDENALGLLKTDPIGRNKYIRRFIQMLTRMEDDCYTVALNGDWGSGKTFFVKQIKMILDAYNPQSNMDKEQCKAVQQCYRDDSCPDSYATVYYDAWAFDNHDDPILSLVYAALKSGCGEEPEGKGNSLNAIFSKTGEVDVGQMTFSDRTREYLYEMESILIPDGNFDFE